MGKVLGGSGSDCLLRGLNIQWPFSQLLLAGLKRVEVRRYGLGHKNIAHAGEEMWLVETPGPCGNAAKNAAVHGLTISPRPAKAQIVGTIAFSEAFEYESLTSYTGDEERHRIRADGSFAWDGDGARHGWVGRARAGGDSTRASTKQQEPDSFRFF